MALYLSPIGNDGGFEDAGNPAVGGLLYTYAAGTSTPAATYADSAGVTVNTNPIVLNGRGEPTSDGNTPGEIWFPAGASFKFVLKNAAGATLWTRDNLSGINDPTAVSSAVLEWLGGSAPVYVSPTSFSAIADLRPVYVPGRKIRATLGGGTVYGWVTAATYDGTNTLVTIEVEQGSPNLDNSLTVIAFGLIQGGGANFTGQSLPLARAGMAFEKINVQALTALLTLTDQSEDVQELNCAAAQTVKLHATAPLAGRRRYFKNTGSCAPPSQIASVAANIVTTDQPHGLVPGQWFRLSINVLGTGVLPANMAGATDFVVLTVPSPTTMTVASSWANYLAGTAFVPGAYAPAAGGQFHGQINPNQALLTIQDAAGVTVAVLPPSAWLVLIAQHSGSPAALGFSDWEIQAASPLVSGQGELSALYGAVGAPAFPNLVQYIQRVITFGNASVTIGPPSKITANTHGYPAVIPPWMSVKFALGSQTLPAPLIVATEFYPLFVDANNLSFACTPGGAAILFTTTGGAAVDKTITPQFHVPPWVQRLGPLTDVTGGGASGQAGGNAGGGGGDTRGPQAVTPNATLVVTVGPGGAAGVGTDSTLVSAAPAWTMTGSGGKQGTNGGGAASGGTVNTPGQEGAQYVAGQGADGGSTPLGPGGRGLAGVARAGAANSGGGGASRGDGVNFGAGGDGQVTINF